jgi:hypothetical protein
MRALQAANRADPQGWESPHLGGIPVGADGHVISFRAPTSPVIDRKPSGFFNHCLDVK